MNDIIAQEIVKRIASEVFTLRPAGDNDPKGLLFSPSARTDEEIVECAQRVIRLSTQVLGQDAGDAINTFVTDIRDGGPAASVFEHTYGLRRKGI